MPKKLKPFISVTLIAGIASVLLTGCITTNNFQDIPKEPHEFRLPPSELHSKYPEINAYERSFWGFSINTPLATDLISAWGEPKEKTKDWGYVAGMGAALVYIGATSSAGATIFITGLVVAIRPSPPVRYYWVKENYCIEAYIDNAVLVENDNAFSGQPYAKRVVSWKWHSLEDSETSKIKECSETIRDAPRFTGLSPE